MSKVFVLFSKLKHRRKGFNRSKISIGDAAIFYCQSGQLSDNMNNRNLKTSQGMLRLRDKFVDFYGLSYFDELGTVWFAKGNMRLA